MVQSLLFPPILNFSLIIWSYGYWMANVKYAIACAFLWDSLLSYLGRQATKYLFQSTANYSLNPPCLLNVFHKVISCNTDLLIFGGQCFPLMQVLLSAIVPIPRQAEGSRALVTWTRGNTLAHADLPPWAAQFLQPPCCHFHLHAKSYGANSAGVCSAWGIHSIWRVVGARQDLCPKMYRVLGDPLPIF